MFSFLKQLFTWNKKETNLTIILIGLDNAGKSTLLSNIQGDLDRSTMPTVGFAKEIVKHDKYSITYFDLGGGEKIRGIWPRYFSAVHGAIFVIDSADVKRMEESKKSLFESVNHPLFKGKSILIFANKQDLPSSLSPSEISESLELHKLTTCRFQIIPCCALTQTNKPTDPNIKKGLNWLTSSIDENFSSLDERVKRESKEEEERERELRKKKFEEIMKRKEEEEKKKEELKKEENILKNQEEPQVQASREEKKQILPPQVSPSQVNNHPDYCHIESKDISDQSIPITTTTVSCGEDATLTQPQQDTRQEL